MTTLKEGSSNVIVEGGWAPVQTLQLQLEDQKGELVAVVNDIRSQVHLLLVEGSKRQFVKIFTKPRQATGPILAVKLQRECIVLVFENYCFVYRIFSILSSKVELDAQVATGYNARGLFDMSSKAKKPVMVFLGSIPGTLLIKQGFQSPTNLLLSEGDSDSRIINAHTSALVCFTVTSHGNMVATASYKGTLIRVFNIRSTHKIREFRRGLETAQITCMAFSACNSWLAVSSHKGTVHIFSMMPAEGSVVTSPFNLLLNKSFAQLHLPRGEPSPTSMSFKGPDLLLLTPDGCHKRFFFDAARGGEMKLVDEKEAQHSSDEESYVEVQYPHVLSRNEGHSSSLHDAKVPPSPTMFSQGELTISRQVGAKDNVEDFIKSVVSIQNE